MNIVQFPLRGRKKDRRHKQKKYIKLHQKYSDTIEQASYFTL